jgi:hypothetical protein
MSRLPVLAGRAGTLQAIDIIGLAGRLNGALPVAAVVRNLLISLPCRSLPVLCCNPPIPPEPLAGRLGVRLGSSNEHRRWLR